MNRDFFLRYMTISPKSRFKPTSFIGCPSWANHPIKREYAYVRPEAENSVALKRWYKRNRPDLSEEQKKDSDDVDSRMEQETASNDAPNSATDEDYRIPPLSFTSDGSDVIVIHPGSFNIRLAKASDSIPRTAPHFICRRMNAETSDKFGGNMDELRAKVDKYAEEMEPIVDALARDAKLRLLPNSGAAVVSFNSQNNEPTKIEEHNDPSRIEWIQDDGGQNFYVGEDVRQEIHFKGSNFAGPPSRFSSQLRF